MTNVQLQVRYQLFFFSLLLAILTQTFSPPKQVFFSVVELLFFRLLELSFFRLFSPSAPPPPTLPLL